MRVYGVHEARDMVSALLEDVPKFAVRGISR